MSLNLRIVTERTAALGVDGHICELQLILRSFAELKVIPHSAVAEISKESSREEPQV